MGVTMTRTFDFYFDFVSPATFVAHKRLPAILARTGATVRHVPMLLGAVFKATGNNTPLAVPAKGRYLFQDLGRYCARHAIDLKASPYFPINTLPLLRGAIAYQRLDRFQPYADAVFDAIWAKPRNLNDPTEIAALLTDAGFDPAEFRALIDAPEVKDNLKVNTEEAIERGVFGAPTFFIGDQIFFGQDRLDWVEEALNGSAAAAA